MINSSNFEGHFVRSYSVDAVSFVEADTSSVTTTGKVYKEKHSVLPIGSNPRKETVRLSLGFMEFVAFLANFRYFNKMPEDG